MSKKHHHKKGMSRRNFLGTASCAAIGSTTFLTSILNLGVANSLAGMSRPTLSTSGDYKALVCILLAGGNDSFNMLIPTGDEYASYAASRTNLAIAQNDALMDEAFFKEEGQTKNG